MTATDLKTLLEVQTWPEEARDELVAVANQIDSELQGHQYLATQQELNIIDAAMASIDAGEAATDVEIENLFAKFRARSWSIRGGRPALWPAATNDTHRAPSLPTINSDWFSAHLLFTCNFLF
jgi:hypothetical protein